MKVLKPTKYQNLQICSELEQLLQALFHKNPQLEFHANNSRHMGLVNQEVIHNVDVFDGDQKVGAVGWVRKYSPSGYDNVYRIFSRRIHKYRGDRNAKTTKDIKSALKICMEVFTRDSDSVMAGKISKAFRETYTQIMWEAHRQYERIIDPLLKPSFEYVISVIDGSPGTIDSKILQAAQASEFRQVRDTYRIAETVQKSLIADTGAIVYTDKDNRLTILHLETAELKKLESTYDLPKNYQEKYTILKVMEFRQPIEGIGVKLSVEVNDAKSDYYYLAPGDTIVTH